MGSSQPICRRSRDPPAAGVCTPGGNAQAFFAPQPLDGLAVDRPVLLTRLGVGTAIPPSRVRAAEVPQLRSECPVSVSLHLRVALGASVLADQLAGPSLRDAQHALQVLHRSTPACSAHQFPRPRSLSGLASSAFMPPYWARQR